jgi:hypothetical protein
MGRIIAPPLECSLIIRAVHSNLPLAVAGSSMSPLTRIVQEPYQHDRTNQQFQIELVPDSPDYYMIRCVGSGLYWDINGASGNNLAEVIQYSRHGQPNQLFRIEPEDDGVSFKIRPVHSGKCLDVYGASTEPGTHVVQYEENGGRNQLFTFHRVEELQQFATLPLNIPINIRAVHSNLPLAVAGSSMSPLTRIVQEPYQHGRTNQQFQIERVPSSPDYYMIRCVGSGLYWDINGASGNNLAEVIQYSRHGQPNQLFRIEPEDDGVSFKIRPVHSGKCLDVYGASTEPGTHVVQYEENGGRNQLFKFYPAV